MHVLVDSHAAEATVELDEVGRVLQAGADLEAAAVHDAADLLLRLLEQKNDSESGLHAIE